MSYFYLGQKWQRILLKYNIKQIIILIFISLILAACGGGSASSNESTTDDGSSSSNSTTNSPYNSDSDIKSNTYTGKTSQAKINLNNAVMLGLEAYSGGDIGRDAMAFRPASPMPVLYRQNLRQAIATLKRSARIVPLPPQNTIRNEFANKSLVDINYGSCGGLNRVKFDLDEVTAKFNGYIEYVEYCDDGITLDGRVEVIGQYDPETGDVSEAEHTFISFSLLNNDIPYILDGSIAWIFTTSGKNQSMSMDLVIEHVMREKSYWYNNYQILSNLNGGYVTEKITGRFFDHDNGYIDVVTQSLLTINAGFPWPESGEFIYTGQANSRAVITFLPTSLEIVVDTDGNDQWELAS